MAVLRRASRSFGHRLRLRALHLDRLLRAAGSAPARKGQVWLPAGGVRTDRHPSPPEYRWIRSWPTFGVGTHAQSQLDVLGARFVVAMTSARGMTSVLATGPSIVGTFGDIIANLGSVLGAFIRAVPGYAVVLLDILDGFTKAAAVVAEAIVPVARVGLAFHGAFLYIGLAVTGIMTLVPWLVATAVSMWGAVAGATGLALAFIRLAASQGILFAASLINPYVAVAAVAVGALVYLILNARSATEQWTQSLQKALLDVPVNSALSTILSDQIQVTNRLTTANQQLATTQQAGITGQTRFGTAIVGTTAAYTAQKAKVDQLTSATTQLSDEASLFNYRLGVLGSMQGVGGATAALGLLNMAGITTKQMLDLNAPAGSVSGC